MLGRRVAWGLGLALLSGACAEPNSAAKGSPLAPTIGHSQPTAAPAPKPEAGRGDPEATAGGPKAETEPKAAADDPEGEAEPDAPAEPPPDPAPEDVKVCEHIVAVVVSEAEEPEGFTEGGIAELVSACAGELAREHLEIGDEEFDRRAACVLSARSVEVIRACSPQEPSKADP